MDLSALLNSMTLNEKSETNITNFAAQIGEHHTEFVVASFINENLLVISQYSKLGSLYKVCVDRPCNELSISEPVFTVKIVFGSSTEEGEAVARYIGEHLNINKPLLIFLNLKDYSKPTVQSVVDAIKNRTN